MNIELNKLIGNIIKEKRKSLKIRQDVLAEKINLSRTSIVNIEKGNQQLTLENLFELSKVFKCTMQDLLPVKPKIRL